MSEKNDPLLRFFENPQDQERFIVLVRERLGRMEGVARGCAGDLAIDICHEVFFKLLVSPRPASHVRTGEGYLIGIVVKTARAHLRAEGRRREREAIAAARRGWGRKSSLAPIDHLAVHEAVAALPPELAQAVDLCDFGSMSTREAAAEVGVTQRTVQSRLAEAHKTLRERLDPDESALVLPVLLRARQEISTQPSAELAARIDALAERHFAKVARPVRSWRRLPRAALLPIAAGLVLVGLVPFLWRGHVRMGEEADGVVRRNVAPAAVGSAQTTVVPASDPVDVPESVVRNSSADAKEATPTAAEALEPEKEDSTQATPEGQPIEISVVDEEGEPMRSGTLTVMGPGYIPTARDRELGARNPFSSRERARDRRAGVWVIHPLGRQNPFIFGVLNEKHFGRQGYLIVEIDGYPRLAHQPYRIEPNTDVEVIVPSTPVATIHVRDAASAEPIGEARLRLTYTESGGVESSIVARTSAETGTATVRGLDRQPVTLEVSAGAYRTARLALDGLDDGRTVWLHRRDQVPTGEVHGVVFKPDATLWADVRVAGTFGGSVRHAVTDARGRFAFLQVPAGRHEITVKADIRGMPRRGRFIHTARVTLADGDRAGLTLGVAPKTTTLQVEIVDAHGEGVPDVMLRVKGTNGEIFYLKGVSEATLRKLPVGLGRFQFLGPSHWTLRGPFEFLADTVTEARLRYGRRTVRGTLVGGEPGVMYECLLSGEDRWGRAIVGEDGAFQLEGVLPGTYDLEILRELQTPPLPFKRTVTVASDDDPADIVIDLTALERLHVRVSDRWGLPPALERVVAVTESGTVFEFYVRPRGTRQREYEALLPPDRYAIEVDSGGQRHRVGGAVLRVGWPRQLDIELRGAE